MQEQFQKNNQEFLNSIKKNRGKVGVFGGGISGEAAIRLLKSLNLEPFLIDSQKPKSDLTWISDKEENPELSHVKLIIKSPGIKPDHPFLGKFKEKNIPIWSEIEMAASFFKGKMVGITGTDGKSTTTSLVFHLISSHFPNSKMGGNIGTAFSDFCLEDLDFAILELSSYQLEDSPNLELLGSTILNLAPDHLERHKSMENYRNAKMKIADLQNSNHFFILNNRQKEIFPLPENVKAKILWFGTDPNCDARIIPSDFCIQTKSKSYSTKNFPLQGFHNLENLAAAILFAENVSVPSGTIQKSLETFSGLKHRFQKFYVWNKIQFINDSKSTNLHSLLSGLSGFSKEQRIYLILGGIPKDEPIEPLLKRISELNVEIFIFGNMVKIWGEKISSVHESKIHLEKDLKDIIQKMKFQIQKESPEYVIFSPGGASFDLYKNFEERGENFMQLVQENFID